MVTRIVAIVLGLVAMTADVSAQTDVTADRVVLTTGVEIFSGTGAPASAEPAGSLYLRTDTGQWYQRIGASWVTVTDSSGNLLGSLITGTIGGSAVWNATAINAANGGTGLNSSGSTGVAQISAGTWSVGTTLQTAVQDNITRLGTLATNVVVGSSNTIGWSDAFWSRDAANAIACRNGTSACSARVYNTYTDASNYERLNLGFSGNIGLVTVGAAGTGASRVLRIGTDATSSGNLSLMTAGRERWLVNGSTGHFIASSDNTNDIGASGANRARDFHLARNAIIGGGVTTPLSRAAVGATYGFGANGISHWSVSVSGHLSALAAYNITTTGDLAVANVLASDALRVMGAAQFDSTISSNLIPTTTDTYDLGRYDRYWNKGFISTLTSVVYETATATLLGGYSIVGRQAGSFAADVSAAATTITFGQTMTPGHWVSVRSYDTAGVVRVEYLTVGTLVSGTTYNVTRDLAGSFATDPAWAAGTPYLVLGASGDGRMEMLAYDGKPRMTFVQQGATYNAQNDRAVLGNLNGYFGYATDVYGLAAGDASTAWIKVDPTNGVRLGFGGTTKISLDASGNASFDGSVTAASGAIGGFTIGTDYLRDLADSFGFASDTSAADDVRLWAGATRASRATAPFSVTEAGVLRATAGSFGDSSGRVAIEAAGLNVGSTGSIRGGQTAYNTGSGFWLGNVSGTPKFSLGNSAGARLTYDGSALAVYGGDFTIGSATSAWDAKSTLKFTRASGYGLTGDIYGLWATASSATNEIRLDNVVVGPSPPYGGGDPPPNATAITSLRAVGWNTETGVAYSTASLSLSSSGSGASLAVVAATSTFTGTLTERGRSTPLGEWIAVAYSAGTYTASTGTWGVDDADESVSYELTGKTMRLRVNVSNTDVSAATTDLKVTIPGGYVAAASTFGTCWGENASGTAETIFWFVASGGTQVTVRRSGGLQWSLTATDNTAVRCTPHFEIQ